MEAERREGRAMPDRLGKARDESAAGGQRQRETSTAAPLPTRRCPVARSKITRATSDGCSFSSSSNRVTRAIGVSTKPGHTANTFTSVSASSSASAR
jgi:hypothetical protein